MSEMVERVARGLAEASIRSWGIQADRVAPLVDVSWHSHKRSARAAIEAMREPTTAMIVQGADGGTGAHITAWRAMIDEALK